MQGPHQDFESSGAKKNLSTIEKSKYFFTIRNFEIFQKVPEHCSGCAGANEGPAES